MMNEKEAPMVGTPTTFLDVKIGKFFECDGTLYKKMSTITAMITGTTMAKGCGETRYFKIKTPVVVFTAAEYLQVTISRPW